MCRQVSIRKGRQPARHTNPTESYNVLDLCKNFAPTVGATFSVSQNSPPTHLDLSRCCGSHCEHNENCVCVVHLEAREGVHVGSLAGGGFCSAHALGATENTNKKPC